MCIHVSTSRWSPRFLRESQDVLPAPTLELMAERFACGLRSHLANELRAAGSQASDDGVDVVDRKCDMADARGVRRRVPVAAPARRGVKLRQLEPAVAAMTKTDNVVRSLLKSHSRLEPIVSRVPRISQRCTNRGGRELLCGRTHAQPKTRNRVRHDSCSPTLHSTPRNAVRPTSLSPQLHLDDFAGLSAHHRGERPGPRARPLPCL